MAQLRRMFFAVALACMVLATAGVAGAAPAAAKDKSRITWSVNRIVETVAPGQSVVVSVTLTSSVDATGVRLRPSGGLGRITAVSPAGPFDLKAGVPVQVQLTFAMPADGAHAHAGAIQVRLGRRNLPAALKVLVKTPHATDDSTTDQQPGAGKEKPAKAKPASGADS